MLDELQTQLGFNQSPNNLLLDTDLDVGLVSIHSYDWPHCIVYRWGLSAGGRRVNGIAEAAQVGRCDLPDLFGIVALAEGLCIP